MPKVKTSVVLCHLWQDYYGYVQGCKQKRFVKIAKQMSMIAVYYWIRKCKYVNILYCLHFIWMKGS